MLLFLIAFLNMMTTDVRKSKDILIRITPHARLLAKTYRFMDMSMNMEME